MDFYELRKREVSKAVQELYVSFTVKRSEDLMVRGRSFYGIWDEAKGLWSTDEYDVQRLVDADIRRYLKELGEEESGALVVKYLANFNNGSWLQFRNYLQHVTDSSVELDASLTFSNTEVKKSDYVSRRLPYPLSPGDYSAYDELMDVLYAPEERAKLEWAIGAVVSGDAKNIQKFIVLYGAAGTGKSTVLNIIQKLFDGYYATFDAKGLTGNNNSFATESFRTNPLVAIQHDGDLSRIEDNTKLNSIISHEEMTINEKFKSSYTARINAFLFMGTNQPVKITDSKSGIIRRLIDVTPTGEKLPPRKYQTLYSQIDFELGAIAYHCLEVYREMGKDYYSAYRPIDMMFQTDVFFNFIEAYYDVFRNQDGASLKQAYDLYKEFAEESGIEWKMPRHKLREELKNYFEEYHDQKEVNGARIRSYFSGFKASHFKQQVNPDEPNVFSLVMDDDISILDKELFDRPAQYANRASTPTQKWVDVKTTLGDLDTTKLHYVKPPENHIVIDFDLTDATGEKSAERNLAAASLWPSTYAEYSKSGHGLHLHYEYEGDVNELSRIYEDGIEIKVFTGDSSLRRQLTHCNSIPVAKISSGLPLKETKSVIDTKMIMSEKSLREQIEKNLRKEVHAGTKSSVDFIKKILDDAFESGLPYDVTDLRPKILSFANNSRNQPLQAIKQVQLMQFQSVTEVEVRDDNGHVVECKCDDCVNNSEQRLVFFDIEVFPNLFLVCWKYAGSDHIVRMINPSSAEIEMLMTMKLVGFNNRKYDNHVLHSAFMGNTNEQIYKLSTRIIANSPNATVREAYNLSYADVYDFASEKMSLKKWEIKLGIPHKESSFPWDQPLDEKDWPEVIEYCENDVRATEAVFNARKQDFLARQILADLADMTVNATTQQLATKIIFGTERHPQSKFNYPNLAEEFPGYEHSFGKSTYRGQVTGEGGLVYSEPGMYEHVVLLDIASMHPTTIEQLNLFGEYTRNYSDLKAARLAIKHGDYAVAREMLGGKLAPYLEDESESEDLSYALKLVINSIYGFTAARFDNPFRDPRNVENIVAKRGALYILDLKAAVEELGYHIRHVKTDSVKIDNADENIIEFVMQHGLKYGYTFEMEETYERFCLVNDAVYIAKTLDGRKPAHWTATGAQFAEPYVFKTLFTKEKVVFEDLPQTKTVQTALYLDFTDLDVPMVFEHGDMQFVGKAGSFLPIKPGIGGGRLVRSKDDRFYAATGAKDWFWLETEMVKTLGMEDAIDMDFYKRLADEAVTSISRFGDFEAFTA